MQRDVGALYIIKSFDCGITLLSYNLSILPNNCFPEDNEDFII